MECQKKLSESFANDFSKWYLEKYKLKQVTNENNNSDLNMYNKNYNDMLNIFIEFQKHDFVYKKGFEDIFEKYTKEYKSSKYEKFVNITLHKRSY